MNFLLHRHLGARDLGSTVAGVGAMLPDLWRMADRHVRPSEHVQVEASRDEPLSLVLEGIRHHVAADRWFHADSAFLDGERDAVRMLREAKIEGRHMGLLAHVLWELCLDGELVRREGSPRVLDALREGFDHANIAMHEAAERHRLGRGGIARPPQESATFDREVDRIRRALEGGPWVLGYADGQGIAARIAGVRARLGLPPLGAEDLSRLAAVAEALLERAVPAVSRILGMRCA